MKPAFYIILLVIAIFSGCMPFSALRNVMASSTITSPVLSPQPPFDPTPTLKAVATSPMTHTLFLPLVVRAYPRSLSQQVRWQIQYTGVIQTNLDVDVFNLDLFDTSLETIRTLHQRGVFVMCYFSAGSYEDWRPDASSFPHEVLGNDLEGWPGEKWLDIRRIDLLAPIMEARLDVALGKGCDGVDPDNVNGYANDTGFPLTADDQKRYNLFLAEEAHRRGLLVGLKNDLEQIPELVPYFDWVLNEECFSYDECDMLLPFLQAGKPVFVIEYELAPSEFCPQAVQMNFNALHKHWELDAYRLDCREWLALP